MGTILQGKRTLVTGAASGCGQAIADLFARQGAKIAVHARSEERIEDTLNLLKEHDCEAHAVIADLSSANEIETMCDTAISALGGLDIVVNVAGVSAYRNVAEMSEADWDDVMDVNLKAPFLVSKFTYSAMTSGDSRGRSYVFISSVSGKTADPGESAYCTSKAGLITFAKCFASEVGRFGVRSNVIAPGWFETKMAKGIINTYAEEQGREFDTEFYEQTMSDNMLGEKLAPSDIAEAALYLASDKARYITAQTLNVCGGLVYW